MLSLWFVEFVGERQDPGTTLTMENCYKAE